MPCWPDPSPKYPHFLCVSKFSDQVTMDLTMDFTRYYGTTKYYTYIYIYWFYYRVNDFTMDLTMAMTCLTMNFTRLRRQGFAANHGGGGWCAGDLRLSRRLSQLQNGSKKDMGIENHRTWGYLFWVYDIIYNLYNDQWWYGWWFEIIILCMFSCIYQWCSVAHPMDRT